MASFTGFRSPRSSRRGRHLCAPSSVSGPDGGCRGGVGSRLSCLLLKKMGHLLFFGPILPGTAKCTQIRFWQGRGGGGGGWLAFLMLSCLVGSPATVFFRFILTTYVSVYFLVWIFLFGLRTRFLLRCGIFLKIIF